MKKTFAISLALAMLVVGAAAATALSSPGTHDEGPYVACVNTKTGAVRMVALPEAGYPECGEKEYSIGWGYPFEVEYAEAGEDIQDATIGDAFVECPDGQMPLGGGGNFSPIPGDGEMSLEHSQAVVMEGKPPYGWGVQYISPDGLPRSGRITAWVACTFATVRGWGD